MDITGLDLGALFSIYFGIGLIRASLRSSETESPEYDPLRKLAVPGYCLLVIGILILGIGLFRHFL